MNISIGKNLGAFSHWGALGSCLFGSPIEPALWIPVGVKQGHVGLVMLFISIGFFYSHQPLSSRLPGNSRRLT